MALSPHQALAIAILIYYIPAIIPAAWLCRRNGLGKQWGWLYLLLFSILRITSAILHVVADNTKKDTENGVRIAASILASIGLMSLLLTMLELIENIKSALLPSSSPIPSRVWTLLHLAQYAAFILSIIFTVTSRDDLRHAAAIIVTCLFGAQALISIIFYMRLRIPTLHTGPSPIQDLNTTRTITITLITICSIPFLTVRVTYMLLSTFTNRDSGFGGADPDVLAAAFMQYVMEFVVFAMFVLAGLLVRPVQLGT